ncbi:MAG: hypothetical protein IIB04_01770, partial [Acidobacteria bacterium]|nr:hypothetical protein [Acidobacteriota bacterium]
MVCGVNGEADDVTYTTQGHWVIFDHPIRFKGATPRAMTDKRIKMIEELLEAGHLRPIEVACQHSQSWNAGVTAILPAGLTPNEIMGHGVKLADRDDQALTVLDYGKGYAFVQMIFYGAIIDYLR